MQAARSPRATTFINASTTACKVVDCRESLVIELQYMYVQGVCELDEK